MVNSMTGFGKGEYFQNGRKFTVEIKSVNHRYAEIMVKLPRVLNAYEDKIKKTVQQSVARGKTDIYISFETVSKDDVKIQLNEALADAYMEEFMKIKERYSLRDDVRLSLLTGIPDLITASKNIDDEKVITEMWDTLEPALKIALDNFSNMRRSEGEALYQDMIKKNACLAELLEKVKIIAPTVVSEYAEKLRMRLDELIRNQSIDESRVLAEIVIFTDKCCIDEEMTRMESHIAQFYDILNETVPNGKKLDFLVQEMNREVNTIGSKSNNMEITKIVIEMKGIVEKIREQIQNIE